MKLPIVWMQILMEKSLITITDLFLFCERVYIRLFYFGVKLFIVISIYDMVYISSYGTNCEYFPHCHFYFYKKLKNKKYFMFKITYYGLVLFSLSLSDNKQKFIIKSVQKIESHTLYTNLILSILKWIIIYRNRGLC